MAKTDVYRELGFLREARKNTQMRMKGGILLSERDCEEYQKQHCPGCARKLFEEKLYFGELFCGECVYKFQRGQR